MGGGGEGRDLKVHTPINIVTKRGKARYLSLLSDSMHDRHITVGC